MMEIARPADRGSRGRARTLEIGAAAALLLALGLALGAFLYVQKLSADLVVALDRGDTRTALSLIRRGARLDARGQPAVHGLAVAAGRGDLSFAQEALRRGVDVNARNRGGGTALLSAAAGPHQEIVPVLLRERGE